MTGKSKMKDRQTVSGSKYYALIVTGIFKAGYFVGT